MSDCVKTASLVLWAGVLVPLSAALGLGCRADKLPTAPSELASGIVVYVDANYLGESAHIVDDISDLRDFRGPCHKAGATTTFDGTFVDLSSDDWNDCISSVSVAPGWSATLYRDDGYRDDSLTITVDVPNLQLVEHDCPEGGLNDCVTSVRVRRP